MMKWKSGPAVQDRTKVGKGETKCSRSIPLISVCVKADIILWARHCIAGRPVPPT